MKRLITLGLFCGLTVLSGQSPSPLLETWGNYTLRGSILVQYTGNEGTVNIPAHLGITEIGESAFANKKLLSVTIPQGIQRIEKNAFASCVSLGAVNFPNSLVSIGEGAFTGCSSLAALSLPSGLEIIGNSAFAGCQKLGKLSIPKNVTVIMDSAFNACSGLMVVALGERIKAVGNQAFGNCGKLTSITAPSNIPYLGSRAVDGNFTGAYNAAGKKGGTYTYSRGFRAWYTGADPVPQAITLTPGTAFAGSMQSYMQEDWYRLHIPAGGRVIIAHTEGSLDTALILYDRDGEKLDEDDDSGDKYNARVSAFALEGPVYLKVSSYRKGNYSLTATLE